MSNQSNETNLMVQGRIVWATGDLFQGKLQTVFGTQTPKLNKQGEQIREYGFGLAVPFADCAEVWNAIQSAAKSIYPQNIPPGFAFKFKNGDTDVDHNGQPYNLREGYAGCLVLSCTTTLPIKFFKYDPATRQNVQINGGIQPGDYVNVQLNIKAHGPIGQGKPGMYLNPFAVQLVGRGKPIVNAPSGDNIFGTSAPVVPQGASAVPLAPTSGMLVHSQQAPVPNMAPQAQQFGPQATQQAPAPSQPNWNVVPQQFAPQQTQQAPVQFTPPAQPAFNPQVQQYQQPMQQQFQAPQAAPQMPMMPPLPQ